VTNYSCLQESQSHQTGLDRIAFPDNHIEVDCRLSFYLGLLLQRYPDALYINAVRDPDAVALSYATRMSDAQSPVMFIARRLRSTPSLSDAHAHHIVKGRWRLGADDRLRAMLDMVAAMNANIRAMASGSRYLEVDIDDPDDGFARAWELMGAEGDLPAALREVHVAHNTGGSHDRIPWRGLADRAIQRLR
jgi:hypothetical protein